MSVATAIAGVCTVLWLSGAYTVLWCLLYGTAADECLLAQTVAVGLYLGHKQHMQTLYVLANAELGCAVSALALNADLE